MPLYTTEGGWLHIETSALVDDALQAKAKGFGGSKIKIGRPHVSEDVARLEAVRAAVGPGFEIMTDCNQRFTVDEAIRRARCLTPIDIAWIEEPLTADDMMGHVRLSQSTTIPVAVGESLYSALHFREYLQQGACSIVQVDVARIGGITPLAEGRASGGMLQRAGLPAFPDGAACLALRRGAECALGRIHPAAGYTDHGADADRERARDSVRRAGPGDRLGLPGNRAAGRARLGVQCELTFLPRGSCAEFAPETDRRVKPGDDDK